MKIKFEVFCALWVMLVNLVVHAVHWAESVVVAWGFGLCLILVGLSSKAWSCACDFCLKKIYVFFNVDSPDIT